ncbi:MAG: usg protein [Rhodospirillales bacterium]|nr:usg protein [Rhodospirillales bacterium]MDE2573965.1 usg protein [Rhodospirillales bacterium]
MPSATHRHSEMQRQLEGYRLTTAEILYHLPDHPAMLQSFIWQELDLAPRYPVLRKFLGFWTREIEGRLHSVRVASVGLISPGEWRHTAHLMHLQ